MLAWRNCRATALIGVPFPAWTLGEGWAVVKSVPRCMMHMASEIQVSGFSCPGEKWMDSDWMVLMRGVAILMND